MFNNSLLQFSNLNFSLKYFTSNEALVYIYRLNSKPTWLHVLLFPWWKFLFIQKNILQFILFSRVKLSTHATNVKQTDIPCKVKQTDNSWNMLLSMVRSQAFCITTWHPPPPSREHPYPPSVVVPSTSVALSLGIFTSMQSLCNVNQPDNPCNEQC